METVIIAVLVLLLLAILINLAPRVSENQRLIIFVVLVALTLLVLLRGQRCWTGVSRRLLVRLVSKN
jgi:hypothetical protein